METHTVITVTMSPEDLSELITSAVRAAKIEEAENNVKSDEKPDQHKKLITPMDIQREFGIHRKLLAYWRLRGSGPAYITFGRRIYYERPVFEAFVASGRVQTTVWVEE